MACSRASSTKGSFGGGAGGDIVTEDIAEFGVDGQFMMVKFGGWHGGWGSCRSCGSCRSVNGRSQEFIDVAQEAHIIRVATPEAAQHGRAGKVVKVGARGGGIVSVCGTFENLVRQNARIFSSESYAARMRPIAKWPHSQQILWLC
jgi:hypothetical protein